MRLLHEKATARSLGVLRIWVFAQWIADLVKDPISPLARIPFTYFEPIGLLRGCRGSSGHACIRNRSWTAGASSSWFS